MTNDKLVSQLRLAADLLETGHPWEWQTPFGEWIKPTSRTELRHVISDGLLIRPILASPPDGRTLNNPDNLTAEQVGIGFRLILKEEVDLEYHQNSEFLPTHRLAQWEPGRWRWDTTSSIRVPLSFPWPETKPDPYAELKRAHAEGKVIQSRIKNSSGEWFDCQPQWLDDLEYRTKPESPTFQLPSPPPAMQWHRTDGWQEGDLPQGWRPLTVGENRQSGDEYRYKTDTLWSMCQLRAAPNPDSSEFYRTCRPLTFTHAGKTWAWHRPGDPMPCDGNKRVIPLVCYEDKYFTGGNMEGSFWNWNDEHLIGWRYADDVPVGKNSALEEYPEKKTVPLGPEDVPPGSVFRGAGEAKNPDDKGWCLITSCSVTGIRYWRHSDSDPSELLWVTLQDSGAQINRSIPLTGKWDPSAWVPCSKAVDA